MSLIQEVFKVLDEQIKLHKVKKVHQVNLKVGDLMAVIPSSLTFCFEILSKGTLFEDTKLIIEEVPVKCRCKKCNNEFVVESFLFSCPKCKGNSLEQLSGNEFMVHNMEVD